MPICIECCYPVSHLYTSYSKADDRSLGKGVRLTQCPRCKRFADKYVEHDYVVLFIDLILIKHQVYRHLLFNRLGRDDDKFDRSIIRLGVLILLFDVYISWADIEKTTAITSSALANSPVIVQYLFFLTVNSLATLAHHLTVRFLASVLVRKPSSQINGHGTPTTPTNLVSPGIDVTSPPSSSSSSLSPNTKTTRSSPTQRSRPASSSGIPSASQSIGLHSSQNLSTPTLPTPFSSQPLRRASTAPLQITPISPPAPTGPSAISTALLVSSCTKLFPILLVIWGQDSHGPKLNRHSSPLGPIPGFTSRQTPAALDAPHPTTPAQPSASSLSLGSFLPSSILSYAFEPFSLLLSVTNTHLVLLNNVEALYILLDCGYARAITMTFGGQLARWTVERLFLSLVGL